MLVGRGYRVVAPDMVGFGKSDKYVSPDNYSVELHMFTAKFLIEVIETHTSR